MKPAKTVSRGVLAGDERVSAAFLIDPVDNTSMTPEGPAYPSACRALRQSGAAIGITGASVICQCNPEGSNHQACAQGSPMSVRVIR